MKHSNALGGQDIFPEIRLAGPIYPATIRIVSSDRLVTKDLTFPVRTATLRRLGRDFWVEAVTRFT